MFKAYKNIISNTLETLFHPNIGASINDYIYVVFGLFVIIISILIFLAIAYGLIILPIKIYKNIITKINIQINILTKKIKEQKEKYKFIKNLDLESYKLIKNLDLEDCKFIKDLDLEDYKFIKGLDFNQIEELKEKLEKEIKLNTQTLNLLQKKKLKKQIIFWGSMVLIYAPLLLPLLLILVDLFLPMLSWEYVNIIICVFCAISFFFIIKQ